MIAVAPKRSTLTPEIALGPLELLVLQPSPFCNIDCKYCYLPNRTSTNRMSMEVLEKTMDRVYESGFMGEQITLLWHAGEPLAVPISWYEEAFEVINRYPGAKERFIHSFQSNGTLVNDAWCEFIKRHQVNIGLSIDGPEFIHDRNRVTRKGAGTHAKAVRGAEKLKEHGIGFGVVSVISDFALDYPDELYHFFLDLKVKGIGFNIEEVEGANASSSIENNQGAEDRVEKFLRRVLELNEQNDHALGLRELDSAFETIVGGPEQQTDSGVVFNLEANPLAVLSVDYAGNFSSFSPELLGQATEKYESFSFGNVRTTALKDVPKSTNFQRVYGDIAEGNRKCATSCPFYAYCGGASPSNKYYENGSFDSAETMHCKSMVQTPFRIALETMEKEVGLA